MKNAIEYVKEYSPKSITVLTLMSKNNYDYKGK